MRNRIFRPLAAALSVLFLTGMPTKAGPVVVSDVVQILSTYQNPPDLRIRSASQTSMAKSSGVRSNVVQSSVNNSPAGSQPNDTVLGTVSRTDSLLEGIALGNVDQNGVDLIDAGDVEGTVCDCGEIPVADGFPLWPLLFLAAVPLFFITDDCDNCLTPDSTPTLTPQPPGEITPRSVAPETVPEPASLLLLGSGLAAFGAGLRRRKAKAKLAEQVKATVEG